MNAAPGVPPTDKPRLLEHQTFLDDDGAVEIQRFIVGGNEKEAMATINSMAAALQGEVVEVEWQRDPPAVRASIVSPLPDHWN